MKSIDEGSRSRRVMAELAGSGSRGANFVTTFVTVRGVVDADPMADASRISKGQLARTVGIAAILKADRKVAPKA